MPTQKDDKDVSKRNINTGGGAYVEGNVSTGGGDFVAGPKIIYTNPPPPTSSDWFEQGKKLLKAGAYPQAVNALEKAIEIDPEFYNVNYYLAIALLRGNRPKLVRLETIRSIENHLKRAIELQSEMGGAYVLWALVKYDFYVLNGMYDRPPSYQDLLKANWSISQLQAQEILSLTNAEDNLVLQWLKKQLANSQQKGI